jgi:hypothetical protein
MIKDVLEEHYVNPNNSAITKYRETTIEDINKNIDYLANNNLLFDSYPSRPLGPFAVVKLSFDELLEKRISSVPMSKFNLNGAFDYYSRISVAVNHNYFSAYFNN